MDGSSFYVDGMVSGKRKRSDGDLDLCLRSWDLLENKIWTDKNRAAFAKCWSIVEETARSVIKGIDVDSLCEFICTPETSILRLASVSTSLQGADTTLSFHPIYQKLSHFPTPHQTILAVFQHCTSLQFAMDNISNHLIAALKTNASQSAKTFTQETLTTTRTRRKKARVEELQPEQVRDNVQEWRVESKSMRRRHEITDVKTILEERKRSQMSCPLLIVVFEDAENIDQQVLRETIASLISMHEAEDYFLNVACVLGLRSSNYQGACGMMSRNETARLRIRNFKPTNSKRVLDELFDKLILNCESPLRLEFDTAVWLSTFFLSTDFSIHGFLRAFHLLAIQHFSTLPGAFACTSLLPGEEKARFSDFELKYIFYRLESVKQHPAAKASMLERVKQVRRWVENQNRNRRVWPKVFAVMRKIYSVMGLVQDLRLFNSSSRAAFTDMAAKSTLSLMEQALNNCSMETLDALVNILVDLDDKRELNIHKLVRRYTEAREQDKSNDRTTALSASLSSSSGLAGSSTSTSALDSNGLSLFAGLGPTVNKKRQRKELRDTVLQRGQSSTARQVFLRWWKEDIAQHWDASKQPLGEFFFSRRHKRVQRLFVSQPRAKVCSALANPRNMQHDTALAFQILQGHKRQRTIPLLCWFSEFCAAVRTSGGQKGSLESMKARFIQAFAELEYLGICALPPRSDISVKVLVHHTD